MYDRNKNKFVLGDCMNLDNGLPSYPDNYFDLAIVDPPYGIGYSYSVEKTGGTKYGKAKAAKVNYIGGDWDKEIPSAAYFKELQRVSKNQIIWGWNYFTDHLPPCRCYVVWNKKTNGNFGDCESAFTSFNRPPIVFEFIWNGMIQGDMKNKEHRIHPTQKPKRLYQKTLIEFANTGDLILDTHTGSASSLIAFESLGFNYHAFEVNPDYYTAAKKRMSAGIQKAMF
jgi:site-specific DNA-methyltransferase (adenine-specific)